MAENDGPFEVVAGIFTGFVIFLGMTGLKILVSMALQNQKYVPLILGLADIGLGEQLYTTSSNTQKQTSGKAQTGHSPYSTLYRE